MIINRHHGCQMGTSMEDAFKHFDKDGNGFISSEGFCAGLQEMGVFQEFSQEEMDQVNSEIVKALSLAEVTFVVVRKDIGNDTRFDVTTSTVFAPRFSAMFTSKPSGGLRKVDSEHEFCRIAAPTDGMMFPPCTTCSL